MPVYWQSFITTQDTMVEEDEFLHWYDTVEEAVQDIKDGLEEAYKAALETKEDGAVDPKTLPTVVIDHECERWDEDKPRFYQITQEDIETKNRLLVVTYLGQTNFLKKRTDEEDEKEEEEN
jgi:hypothetical protein